MSAGHDVEAALTIPLTADDDERIDELFEQTEIRRARGGDVVALGRYDGKIIGVIVEHNGDELSIVVDEGHRGCGVATAMLRAFLKAGGTGFMVAGTDDGVEFLGGLYHKLTPEEREVLDVPSWASLEVCGG